MTFYASNFFNENLFLLISLWNQNFKGIKLLLQNDSIFFIYSIELTILTFLPKNVVNFPIYFFLPTSLPGIVPTNTNSVLPNSNSSLGFRRKFENVKLMLILHLSENCIKPNQNWRKKDKGEWKFSALQFTCHLTGVWRQHWPIDPVGQRREYC